MSRSSVQRNTTANFSARQMARFTKCVLNEEAAGFEAVCVLVNDQVNAKVMAMLKLLGVQRIASRVAVYNNVDLAAAKNMALQWCAYRRTRLTRWRSTPSPLCWRSTGKRIARIIASERVISSSTAWAGRVRAAVC